MRQISMKKSASVQEWFILSVNTQMDQDHQ